MFGAVDWYGTLSTDSDIDRFIELLDSIEGFGLRTQGTTTRPS